MLVRVTSPLISPARSAAAAFMLRLPPTRPTSTSPTLVRLKIAVDIRQPERAGMGNSQVAVNASQIQPAGDLAQGGVTLHIASDSKRR